MKSFNSTKYFYHYTSLDALLKIISSKELKFGALPRMNDITEATKEFYLDEIPESTEWDKLDLVRQKISFVGQISLSQDAIFPGYALHAMWGHYAECGEGCCIVFDKSKIMLEAEAKGYCHRAVIYDEASEKIILPSNQNVDNYLSEQCERLFFHKRIEWEHEQEYRLINFNCNHTTLNGLSINEAIVAVIFHTNCNHRALDCPKVKNCISTLGNIPALEYHYSSMWGNKQNNMLIDRHGNDWLVELQNTNIEI